MSKRLKFFKVALKNYKTSGTLTPSSRFLAKRMLSYVDFNKANVLVELGPGNGAITRKILNNLHPEAHLICFEINTHFYKQLQEFNHPQLTVLNVSAEHIVDEINKLGHQKTCHIISSLPLSILPEEVSANILHDSYEALDPKGSFIQYQYSLTYYKKLKRVFKDAIRLDFELLNFPPAFVYCCKKAI